VLFLGSLGAAGGAVKKGSIESAPHRSTPSVTPSPTTCGVHQRRLAQAVCLEANLGGRPKPTADIVRPSW
jgi:hypothetical protein